MKGFAKKYENSNACVKCLYYYFTDFERVVKTDENNENHRKFFHFQCKNCKKSYYISEWDILNDDNPEATEPVYILKKALQKEHERVKNENS